jgi:hypothetical protein
MAETVVNIYGCQIKLGRSWALNGSVDVVAVLEGGDLLGTGIVFAN